MNWQILNVALKQTMSSNMLLGNNYCNGSFYMLQIVNL